MATATPTSTSTIPKSIDVSVPWCLTDEHRLWRESVRAFADREVAPVAAESSAKRTFPLELVGPLAELGCFGLLLPKQYGGAEADITSQAVAIEELARVDSSVAITVHVQAASTALLEHLGRPEQVGAIIRRAVRGETFVSYALTEPSGGSDAGNVSTRAVRDGADWILNGSKQFITNAGTPRSEYAMVFAATGDGVAPRRPAISAFLVPLDGPGVTVGPAYDKLGWRASDTHPLFFEDVRLPGDALLGEEGRAYKEALACLTWARLPISAMAVGVSQGCLDDTLRFVQEREAFGSKLAEFQSVAFACAELAAITASARTLLYDACWKRDHGYPFDQEAAICKYVTAEIANKAAYLATELHGGYGFINETAVTRRFADARVLTIGEGTSAIQRLLIARSLGLPV
jgi:short/branched chain acyl-CoA dehydrogenase